MKRKLSYLLIASTFLFSSVLISCGDDESGDDIDTTTIESNEIVTESVADFSAGEIIYTGKGMCQTCHMANGKGIEGTFPPLADSDYLSSIDKAAFIKMVMKGSNDPITVNGKEYPGKIMGTTMSTVTLTDQEIVDVVNFVLNKWGNKETVTITDVTEAK